MSAPTCVCCARPMSDVAYACPYCGVTKPTEQLTSIADMLPAARDVAHGLSRRSGGAGAAAGKPGSRLPLDLGATSRLDNVEAALTAHVDHIGTIRGITRPWFEPHGDAITAAARWLTAHGNLEWMRHREDARQFLTDIDRAARVVAGIAKGPAAQRYLGPCGAPISTLSDETRETVEECPGDIYARDGALSGSCRDCRATITVAERRAWLDAEVRSHAFRAAHIAQAYNLNVKTIRSWADRGHLRSYWRTDSGIVAAFDADPPVGETRERLHYVGDVLDLAAADAARKAEDQARRARRATRRDNAA